MNFSRVSRCSKTGANAKLAGKIPPSKFLLITYEIESKEFKRKNQFQRFEIRTLQLNFYLFILSLMVSFCV